MSSNQNPKISTWAEFDRRIRYRGLKLLGRLDHYYSPVLVAGCQRSGTTALTRMITASEGMNTYKFSRDEEMDAAQILSGWVEHEISGRYCFQTTYLNNSYPEYFEHNNYKLIWVLRNPASVVYSMLHNWKGPALNRLFRHCGSQLLNSNEHWIYSNLGSFTISRLKRACLSYKAKISQTFILNENLHDDRLMIIDYESMINHKDVVLPAIYEFVGLPYRSSYSELVNSRSLDKAKGFYERNRAMLDAECMPIYEKACELISGISVQSQGKPYHLAG